MALGDQSALVFWASALLYLGVAFWMLDRGCLIRAGFATAIILFPPLAWQVAFTDSDAPGFGFLFVGMAPISLLLLVLGLARLCIRAVRERRARA